MRLVLTPVLIILGVLNSQAAELSSNTIHLRQILETVQKENPEIRAALKLWEAAKKRTVQAATPENPRLDLERMYAPRDESVVSAAEEKNTAIFQELPFPNKLYLRAKVASKEAGMAEQKYLAKRREVMTAARTNYAMLYLAHRSLEILNENIELMRRFAKVAESKYVAGHVSQTDVLKAQVELGKMLNMLVVMNQEKDTAEAVLNALMGKSIDSILGSPASPDSAKLNAELAQLEEDALKNRPELREAALGLERAGSVLSLARSEFLPDLMLGYRRRNMMTGDSHDAMLGFSLPLWFWGPASMASEAKAEKEMAKAEFESMRLMTLSGVKIAFIRAQAAQRLIELYQTGVLPQAESALKIAESGYRSGKTSFLDLVDTQRTLLNFNLEYQQYIAEYEARLAELDRAAGKEIIQ